MLKVTILLGGISIAFLGMHAAQAADSVKISCTGDTFEPGGVNKSHTTLTAIFSPTSKATQVLVDLGKGSVSPVVLSNNPLQLKFRTKDFTGEYFHYSGDMFLIYRSGHLARLTCSPSWHTEETSRFGTVLRCRMIAGL
jgi:hypothetical protein